MSGFNASDWALRHRSIVVYAMIVALMAGAASFLRLGRSEDPSFAIKTMIVETAWPGASVEDTISQVTERVERKLQEVPGLDYLRSYTTAGQSVVYVTVQGSVPASALADTWYQVRKKIGDIRLTLPQGVIGPGFDDEFGDTYGIIYAFTADGFSDRELRDRVEDVRSDLLGLADISKIDVLGAQDERITIEFSPAKLAGLGLNEEAFLSALRAQNAVTPAGVVDTGSEKVLVRVSGGFTSQADLERINIAANGRLVRLVDVADIRRGPVDPAQPRFRVNGKPAIGLAISMRQGGDILALGHGVATAMSGLVSNLPIGIEATLVADQATTVEHAVDDFTEALWEAIAIVLAVSFLSLGMRAGAVVALSIPIVLAITFVGMELAGVDLQRISLGALIIALGLLVDDAMITVEMMVSRLEEGDTKFQAATFAYTSTAFPMLTGTLVTIAGFVPIGFARSSAGEYTFSIFVVVGIALIASWFVAVIFAPLIGVAILRAPKGARHTSGPGRGMRLFRRLLVGAMRLRWITFALTIAVFAASLWASRLVPHQFFPASDRTELLVDLKLPQNASIDASERAAEQLDATLRGDADIRSWSTYAGRGAVRFYLPLNAQLPNDFLVQAVIVTQDLDARERVHERLESALATRFPEAISRVYPLEQGPPVGWPIQYRVSGPKIDTVREISMRLAGVVGSDPGATQINFDWMEPARTLRIEVDQDQVRLLGISSQALAQSLDTVVSGATVTTVRDGIYLVDVVARAAVDERVSPDRLRDLQLPLPNGRTVPLSQVARISYGQELPIVWRRDRVPTLTVQADTAPGVLPATVVAELEPKIRSLAASLPPGYAIATGGALEESGKSQRSVAAVVPLMLFLTLSILLVQLQSFQRLFLVLSVAPLGVIGVVAALLVADKPLGFVAILGILALIGMIARNSVILIDQIETHIRAGEDRWDAVVEATCHRLRPILLTAAAAILGMIPIATTVFWGPMAYAIMGGLGVATLLTLVFLPALYVAWFRVREGEGAAHEPEGALDGPVGPAATGAA